MAAKKGHVKVGGRKKGTPNKVTVTIREMIVTALDRAGGVNYLIEQAQSNPTAFLTLVGKVLPTQISGDTDNPIEIKHITRVIIESENPDS